MFSTKLKKKLLQFVLKNNIFEKSKMVAKKVAMLLNNC